MFAKLFAESGLSLDRLRSLVEVGSACSIVKAAEGDPVRQSQYSRQIKELEDFFRVKLIERQGKGTRLTSDGKELARISRFFLLGLSNFKRGCLAEAQTFRIGASATFIRQFLLPVIAVPALQKGGVRYVTETLGDDEIERRLHDLTLDFGIVRCASLSRPLQTKLLGNWKLGLWVPKSLNLSKARAMQEFEEQSLPLVLAGKELDGLGVPFPADYESRLVCDNFLDVRSVIGEQRLAGLLPDFLAPSKPSFLPVPLAKIDSCIFHFHLAWNPRLLRLNSHAIRSRDLLSESLGRQMGQKTRPSA